MEVVLTQIKGDPVLFVHQDGGKIFRVESHDGGKSWGEAAPVEILSDSPFASLMSKQKVRQLVSAASDGRHVMLAFEGVDPWISGAILWSDDGGQRFKYLFDLPPETEVRLIHSKESGWWAIANHHEGMAAIAAIMPLGLSKKLTRHGQEWPNWGIMDVAADQSGIYLLVESWIRQYGALEVPWGGSDCHDWVWFPPRIRSIEQGTLDDGAICMMDQIPIFLLPFSDDGEMEIFVGDAPIQGIIMPAPGYPASMEWFPKYRHLVALFWSPSQGYVAAWAKEGSFDFEISWEEEE